MSALTMEIRALAQEIDQDASNAQASTESRVLVLVAKALNKLAYECESLERVITSRTEHLA